MKGRRGIREWVIATRPWSFPASVMPILIMWAYLFYGQSAGLEGFNVDWLNALLCLPLIVLIHAGGNMVSDYYDWKKNVDKPDGPNGVTWIFDHTFDAREILHYGYVLVAVGVVLGLVLLAMSTWEGLWIGAAGLLMALGYPWMKAHLLGDVNILTSFALLPAIGTSLVSTGCYHPETLLYILPIGCLTISILHANNTRDIHNDAGAGLKTVSDTTGGAFSKRLYYFWLTAPYVLTLLYSLLCGQPLTLLITLLTLPVAVGNIRTMAGADSRMIGQIPTLDKSSAQLQTMFGVLYAAGYTLWPLVSLILN